METYPSDSEAETSHYLQYTPEEIEEMFERPSDFALQRAEQLSVFTNAYYDFSRDRPDTPLDRYKYFLAKQDLGFSDELVVALHGSDQDVTEFLGQTLMRKPSQAVRYRRIFSPYFTPEKIAEFTSLAIKKGDFTFDYEIIDAVGTEEERDKYSRLHVIHYCQDHPQLKSMAPALLRTKEFSAQYKRNLLHQALQTSEFLFEQIDLDDYLCGTASKTSEDFDTALRTVESVRRLIHDDLITARELEDNLQKRIDGRLPGVVEKDDHQFRDGARDAKLLLDLHQVLRGSDTPPPEQLAVEYLSSSIAGKSRHGFSRSLAAMIQKGWLDKEDAIRQLEAYETERGTKEAAQLQFYIHELNQYGDIRHKVPDELDTHTDDKKIKDLYTEYILGGRPITDLDRYIFACDVINYAGDEASEEAMVLVETYTRSRKLPVGFDNFDRIKDIFSGDEERLRRLLAEHFDPKHLEAHFGGLREVAAFIGLEQSAAHDFMIRDFSERADTYMLLYDIARALEDPSPLIMIDESIEILIRHLHEHELKNRYISNLAGLCMNFFGRDRTEHFFGQIRKENPRFDAELGVDIQNIRDRYRSDEYYDICKNAEDLRDVAGVLDRAEMDEYMSRFLSLGDDHVADLLWHVWDYMDTNQRIEALERTRRNPALAAMLFEYDVYREMAKTLGWNSMIPASPTQDPLMQLAPKAYAQMKRRLGAKDITERNLSTDRQKLAAAPEDRWRLVLTLLAERQEAASPYPETLEGSRRNVLVNYAYYYDLCLRIKDMQAVKSTFPYVRGKSTEKNELRALELMTLLHEAAGIADAAVLSGNTKEQLESMAFTAVLSKVRMNDAEAKNALANLSNQGVDPVKFGMWLHTSFRSQKLQSYLGEFMRHVARGGTVEDWKFSHPLGDNLPASMTQEMREAWRRSTSAKHNLGNGTPIQIDITNDLNALYLCGARPINNCLHYGYGLNQRAGAGLLNADSKILNMTNANGNPIGNAIMRIATEDNKPVLVVEPLYASEQDPDAKANLHRYLLIASEAYAKVLGIPLHVALVEKYDEDMRRAYRVLWSDTSYKSTDIVLAQSNAPFTYSDQSGLASKKTYARTAKRLTDT